MRITQHSSRGFCLNALRVSLCLAVAGFSGAVSAAEPAKSADEVARELSNPAGSLASLNMNIQYPQYKGDLPNADDQNSTSLLFQPALPFPIGDQGRRMIFRPAIPVFFNQPFYDPAKGDFDEADTSLGDTTFDLVYAGTTMTHPKTKEGYLWGIGAAGTLRTATDDDIAGKQWRLGPELFGGILREWGIVGALVSNQWDVAGSDNVDEHSVMTAQYFYAYSLGQGWQISSSPIVTYDWKADSDDALTLPLGVGLARTMTLGDRNWKFQGQVQYFVEQPDQFCPDWLLKFTVTPVVQNKLANLFR